MLNNIIQISIVLFSMAIVACQSTSPTKAKSVDSVAVENLNIDMLNMSYTPAILNVPHAGRYSVKVTNTATYPHDIVFSNGVKLAVAPSKQTSAVLDIERSRWSARMVQRAALPADSYRAQKPRRGTARAAPEPRG